MGEPNNCLNAEQCNALNEMAKLLEQLKRQGMAPNYMMIAFEDGTVLTWDGGIELTVDDGREATLLC